MRIEDVTWGETKQGLLYATAQIYNEDTCRLRRGWLDCCARWILPLFRLEEGRQAVVLVAGVVHTRPSKRWVNLVMFLLTLLSVLLTGATFSFEGNWPTTLSEWVRFLLSGLPFAASMLAILAAHEFGHYLMGRYHKTDVSLPYFIPLPFSYFGTMGAFIQLKEPPKNRRILLDIGIAGPLAGLVVAIPLLILGLALSPVEQIPFNLPAGQAFEGNSILYLLLKYIVHGELLPKPFNFYGVEPAMYWLRYFFTGAPLPRGGWDVTLHPVAWAGWAGLLVTALNLIPAGQFDGGHVMYVLLGKRMTALLPYILGRCCCSAWFERLVAVGVPDLCLGRMHAEPLTRSRRWTGRKAIAVSVSSFILLFTPVPLVQIML
jgi:membrane-associated protease RseP (regulator of RpoE activity)